MSELIRDPNKERGEKLFVDKLTNHGLDLTALQEARLQALRAAFRTNVGIMPLQKEGIYGAAKLAKAVLEVVQEDDPTLDQNEGIRMVHRVLEIYQSTRTPVPAELIRATRTTATGEERKIGEVISNQLASDATPFERQVWEQQQEVMRALMETAEQGYVGLNNGIDLIKDIKKADLGIEGLRVRGYLPADFDTMAQVKPELIEEESEPQGIVTLAADGTIERIQCPFCVAAKGNTYFSAIENKEEFVGLDLYTAGLDRMGCFDCDKEFEVELTLDDQMAKGDGFWHDLVDEEDDELPPGFGSDLIIVGA